MKTILSLLLALISLSAQAGDDVFDIAEKYNSEKKQVIQTESKKRKVLSEIYEIEKETKKLVSHKSNLNERKAQQDYKLSQVSKKIVKVENDLYQMTPELMERISFLDQIQNLPWFYAFMTSQSIQDLDQLNHAAQNLNQKQAENLKNFVALHESLKREKKVLLETAREIVSLKKDILVKEKAIEKNQKNKNRSLKNLDARLLSQKKNLNILKILGRKALQKSELKNLSLLFGTDFFDKKGKLLHPIKAPIVQGFGLIDVLGHDQVELMSKGQFYRVSKGKNVKAVAAGRVRFSGKIKGSGYAVIIDHGGRYYSVYGNLQKSFLNKNSLVKAEQKIGLTGKQHMLFEEGLYFEIRHFSEPQDPSQWLKPIQTNLATL